MGVWGEASTTVKGRGGREGGRCEYPYMGEKGDRVGWGDRIPFKTCLLGLDEA